MGEIVRLIAILSSLPLSLSFCPAKCVCDNDRLEASCIDTSLEVRINKTSLYAIILS